MKIKRILSSALVFVMLFSSMVSLLPLTALAADAGTGVTVSVATGDSVITNVKEIQDICAAYLKYGSVDEENDYTFDTAEELLQYEMGLGYLDSVSAGNYTLYINRYTGFVYYKNMVTGQIVTSSPIDPASMNSESVQTEVMSQLVIDYYLISNPGATAKTENSLSWIMKGSTMSLSPIENGISAKYCIGEVATSVAFLVPDAVVQEDFNKYIVGPGFATLAALLEEACGPLDSDKLATVMKSYKNARVKAEDIASYDVGECEIGTEYYITDVTYVINVLKRYAMSNGDKTVYNKISALTTNLTSLFGYYTLDDPEYDKSFSQDTYELKAKKSLAYADGTPVYFIKIANTSDALATYRIVGQYIAAVAPEYTADTAAEHEDNAGYLSEGFDTPSFTCSVNYTLDEEGKLSVEIPANSQSLSYNNSVYAISSVTPLKYFGAGNMNYDGYFFYPDGSGTIVEFGDFYFGAGSTRPNINLNVESDLYGYDYCYSRLVAEPHREQITMPVFGIVSEVPTNDATKAYTSDSTVTNGLFAVVEEGSSLTRLVFKSDASSHKYGFTYASFAPTFSDIYDLSQSLSVSGLGSYKMFATAGYSGNFKLVYKMLDDTVVAEAARAADKISSYYASDYLGMAEFYRDYLSDKGVLEALEQTSLDLPLYIEALGSIDVTKKILTFPVTVSESLTTFEDVASMYKDLSELSGYVTELEGRAENYRERAQALIDNPDSTDEEFSRAEQYIAMAEHYEDLAGRVEDIKNVNFKLTGFANGGMYFTYPAKVKWESSVGGKRGFNDLLAYAKEVNKLTDANLGIYPDFDFVYINNTAAFDGVTTDRHAACMIDNRYASKQVYDSVSQEYETIYALLASSDNYDNLYSKFVKKYSKFDVKNLSVSTLGSDLNSNLNVKNMVDREASLGNVKKLLDRMANTDGYSLMTEVGNSYALEYVDHVINVSIDSSHLIESSYAIPFFGLVFHGSMNYAGAPLNYSGSPEYEMLRSIENGASLYYILCCENTGFLKEDPLLSDYYGIDYENWFDKIVEQYTELNEAIGDLQNHRITSHEILFAERVIDGEEEIANYNRLALEYIAAVESCLSEKIDAKQGELKGSSIPGLEVIIDRDSLMYSLAEKLGVDFANTGAADKLAVLKAVSSVIAEVNSDLASYAAQYPAVDGAVKVDIDSDSIKLADVTVDNVAAALRAAIDGAISATKTARPGRDIALNIDSDEIVLMVCEAIGLGSYEASAALKLDDTIRAYEKAYSYSANYAGEKNTLNFASSDVQYESLYSYTTDSLSTDKENYKYTDFTCDNGSVVMVTYEKDGETAIFLLNYNFFAVEITVDNTVDKSLADGQTKTYVLGKYEHERIDNK